jgi:hypothetical protein
MKEQKNFERWAIKPLHAIESFFSREDVQDTLEFTEVLFEI